MALHAFIVVVEHEACVTADFDATFAVSLEAVFADEWTDAGRFTLHGLKRVDAGNLHVEFHSSVLVE